MVSKADLLNVLPQLQGERDTIVDRQETKDIVREVLAAHEFFKSDYDKIAPYFRGDGIELYREIFDFLKRNVKYVIESNALQTTRSPGALLTLGYGDCKHYAGFIAGVLDAKNRAGERIKWCYRFASYKFWSFKPQHVFVVALDEDNKEVWIDPVLPALNTRRPHYYYKQDKKPATMLQRIYGIGDINAAAWPAGFHNALLVGYWSKTLGASIVRNYALKNTAGTYPIRYYVDGQLFLNFPTTEAYKLRLAGKPLPMPPQGITVEYPAVWDGKPVPADMLRPYIDASGKMYIATPSGNMYDFPFTKTASNWLETANSATNKILIADNNRLLNLLIAATGAIQLAYQPYPDAENLQRFYDTMLRLRDYDFMKPREINSFVENVAQGFKDAIKEIGQGFVTFIGIIPRQAFLLAVRINGFNMAANLDANIREGNGPEIRKKWEGFGGEWSTLLNAINQGKTKNAILGGSPEMNAIAGTVDGIGEMTLAAALAAAAPIIALLGNFLKKIGGPEVDAMVDKAIGEVNKVLIAAGKDPIALSEALGGKPVEVTDGDGNTYKIPASPGGGSGNAIIDWVKANPEKAAAAGAGIILVGAIAAKASKSRRA